MAGRTDGKQPKEWYERRRYFFITYNKSGTVLGPKTHYCLVLKHINLININVG